MVYQNSADIFWHKKEMFLYAIKYSNYDEYHVVFVDFKAILLAVTSNIIWRPL